MRYDSRQDTEKHIARVRAYLAQFQESLSARGVVHDQSKLQEPEKSFFDKYTPLLAALTYGSKEYKKALADLQPALKHHYRANSHHPEHYGQIECDACFAQYPADYDARCMVCGNGSFSEISNGANVAGMSLLDVVEMLADWKAATERHDDGDIEKSLEINADRFNLSPQLYSILKNTIDEMGWSAR